MAITTLLLDADGVVQTNQRLLGNLEALLDGQASMKALLLAEQRSVMDGEDLRLVLDEFVAEHHLSCSTDDLLAVWCDTEPDAEVLALVDRVRAGDVVVSMATNQQPVRGQWMLDALDYADHFDDLFFSFRMGTAKPRPAYFEQIIATTGVDPQATLFIDDLPDNVASARSVGLHAEVHDPADGVAGLERILDRYGVRH